MGYSMSDLSPSQLAAQAHVNVTTIRFYERRGLLPEPSRRESGYRRYPVGAVQRIHFIKRAQELGFTLEQIRELLALDESETTTCADVRHRAEQHLADVRQKFRMLGRMEKVLTSLVEQCPGEGIATECPILSTLNPIRRKL